jgi:putative transcriptional regulator
MGLSLGLDLRGVVGEPGSDPPAIFVKNRLRVLRAEQTWSQGDLAERLGVSRQTVNAIETGKYDPSLPLAFRMARLFGLRIEEIFEEDGNGQAS